MKIAVTASGLDLNSPLDPRFGRASFFIIYDTEQKTFIVASNEQNLNAPQGAGIQSAVNVAKTGASSVITGHCGPKAFKVLEEAKITVYQSSAATVQEALDQFLQGGLKMADQADVEGHWV